MDIKEKSLYRLDRTCSRLSTLHVPAGSSSRTVSDNTPGPLFFLSWLAQNEGLLLTCPVSISIYDTTELSKKLRSVRWSK